MTDERTKQRNRIKARNMAAETIDKAMAGNPAPEPVKVQRREKLVEVPKVVQEAKAKTREQQGD